MARRHRPHRYWNLAPFDYLVNLFDRVCAKSSWDKLDSFLIIVIFSGSLNNPVAIYGLKMIKGKKILVTGGAGFIGVTYASLWWTGTTWCRLITILLDTGQPYRRCWIHLWWYRRCPWSNTNWARPCVSPWRVFRVEQSFDDMEIVWRSNKLGTFAVLNSADNACWFTLVAVRSLAMVVWAIQLLADGQKPLIRSCQNNYIMVFIKLCDYLLLQRIRPREISTKVCDAYYLQKMRWASFGNSEPRQSASTLHVCSWCCEGTWSNRCWGVWWRVWYRTPDSFSVIDAKMFGGRVQMLESRRGNRLAADLVTDKTMSLGGSLRWEL